MRLLSISGFYLKINGTTKKSMYLETLKSSWVFVYILFSAYWLKNKSRNQEKKWFSQEHGYKNQLNEKIVKTMLSKYAIRVSTVGMRGLSNSAFASNPNYRTNLNVFNKKLCFINGGGVLIPKLQELRQMSSLADEIIKNKKQAQWTKMSNPIWKISYVKAKGPGIEL